MLTKLIQFIGNTLEGKNKLGLSILNTTIFLVIFFASSYAILNDYAAVEDKQSLFNIFRSKKDVFSCSELLKGRFWIQFTKRNIWIQSISDSIKILGRTYLSSFLKDAVIATVLPVLSKGTVNPKLTDKLETRTFYQSWIPTNAMTRDSDLVPSERKTTVLTLGRTIINLVEKVLSLNTQCVLKIIATVQWALTYLINHTFIIICFFGKSIICTFMSLVLVLLHSLQLVLRSTRKIYNYFEFVLSFCCIVTNDLSLLAVEVVKDSSHRKGQDLFDEFSSKREIEVKESGDGIASKD